MCTLKAEVRDVSLLVVSMAPLFSSHCNKYPRLFFTYSIRSCRFFPVPDKMLPFQVNFLNFTKGSLFISQLILNANMSSDGTRIRPVSESCETMMHPAIKDAIN